MNAKILKFIKHPKYILLKLDQKKIIRLNDKKFIELNYEYELGKKVNLNKPKTFNEKLQWMKLYDHNELYTKLVDKYEVKEYVKSKIGEKYIIPTLGIYEKFDDIDFEKLPNEFVIKCTHDSGSTKIIKDKRKLNISKLKKEYTKKIKNNYYNNWREWPYKNVKPRIIIEKMIKNNKKKDDELNDYKIQCFNGEPDTIMVCVDRYKKSGVKYHYFTKKWKYLPYNPYPGINENNVNVEKPSKLNEMIEIARKLSKGLPEVRVDLYYVNENIYFGEMTFFSSRRF